MTYQEKKKIIINYLKDRMLKTGIDYYSPTEIGSLFGGHSSIGSPLCKRMVSEGLMKRNNKGHYKITHTTY